jgi:hypothetical protein
MTTFLKTIFDNTYIKPVYEKLEDCLQQGEAASSQMYMRDQNPYPEGTAKYEWWDGGFLGEQDELLGIE